MGLRADAHGDFHILYRWALDAQTSLYAVVRMLIQLLLIGYVLTSIFRGGACGGDRVGTNCNAWRRKLDRACVR